MHKDSLQKTLREFVECPIERLRQFICSTDLFFAELALILFSCKNFKVSDYDSYRKIAIASREIYSKKSPIALDKNELSRAVLVQENSELALKVFSNYVAPFALLTYKDLRDVLNLLKKRLNDKQKASFAELFVHAKLLGLSVGDASAIADFLLPRKIDDLIVNFMSFSTGRISQAAIAIFKGSASSIQPSLRTRSFYSELFSVPLSSAVFDDNQVIEEAVEYLHSLSEETALKCIQNLHSKDSAVILSRMLLPEQQKSPKKII